MDLASLGEFGLIERIRQNFPAPEGLTGIGDDCAILPQKSGISTLVSTDMLIEGTHFLLEDVQAYQLGWKSAAVNISDIAAMGGTPRGSFLSFALPKGLSAEWMEEFIRGYRDISTQCSCPLLGGDTTSSGGQLCICVTVLGDSPEGQARMRSEARPGDLVCTTGFLGDSGGGLKVILGKCERDSDAQTLVRRHYLPQPRVQEGRALAATPGVHAMMDISDGVGSDLRHILRASGVGAWIDTNKLPVSEELCRCCGRHGWDPAELALCGGEDYELLFTISPEAEKSLKVRHFVIGEIVPGNDLVWEGAGKDYMGYRHF